MKWRSGRACRARWNDVLRSRNATKSASAAESAAAVRQAPACRRGTEEAVEQAASATSEIKVGREAGWRVPDGAHGLGRQRSAPPMARLRAARRGADDTAVASSWVQLTSTARVEWVATAEGTDAQDAWNVAGPRRVPVPPPAVSRKVERWKLREAAGTEVVFACDLEAAEQRLRRHLQRQARKEGRVVQKAELDAEIATKVLTVAERDAAGMVTYGSQAVIDTITARPAHRKWLGGPAMGDGRFMTHMEEAEMMQLGDDGRQHNQHGGGRRTVREVMEVMGESGARAAGADAMHGGFADVLVRKAMEHPRWPAGRWTYGSLWSGAYDSTYWALRRAGTRLDREHRQACEGKRGPPRKRTGTEVDFLWAAESNEKRRDALARTARPRRVHREVASCQVAAEERVTLLGAGPPCVYVSTARRRRGRRSQKQMRRTTMAKVMRDTMVIARYIVRHQPLTVVIEQSAGLRRAHKQAFKWMNAALRKLPYKWWRGELDAARELGACHTRRRIGWVGHATAAP